MKRSIVSALFVIQQAGAMDLVTGPVTSHSQGEEVIDVVNITGSINTTIPMMTVANNSATTFTIDQNDVNLNEDVPGCMDDYFRFKRNFWLVAEGWIDLSATMTMAASTTLTALTTQGNFDEAQGKKLGIAAITLGSIASGLMVFKAYSMKAVKDSEDKLYKIIEESHRGTGKPTH